MIKVLQTAYCNDDPSSVLYRSLDSNSIRACDVTGLLSCVEDSDVDPESPCWSTLKDRDQVQKLEIIPAAARLGYYVYFSTALSQVWLTSEQHIDSEQPIITYAAPNVPVSYVWLDVNAQVPRVIRHNLAGVTDLLLFSIHVYDGLSTLETSDLSCNLQTGLVTRAVSRSGWATIGFNAYTHRAQLKTAHRNGICFMVVLTCAQVWSGMYLHDGRTGRAHTMACVVHR